MKNPVTLIVSLLLLVGLNSCGEGKKIDKNRPKLPNAIGHMGEIAIVGDGLLFEGTVREAFDSVFDIRQPYFFNDEGYFRIFDVRPEMFQSVYKSYSTLLIIKVQDDGFDTRKILPAPYNTLSDSLKKANDTAAIRLYTKKNIWAYPQQVVFLYAKNHEVLHRYLLDERKAILDLMLRTEAETFAVANKNERQDSIGKFIKQNFGFTMDVPTNFRVARYEEKGNGKFAWVRRETPHISQGLLIYTQTYTRKEQLGAEEMVLSRDSVVEKYIPGSVDGSYMTTEKAFPFATKAFEFNGKYSVELRALWKTEGEFMGGPFYSITMIDEATSQLITVEGFVYSPRYDKTQYLRQMEVIVKSLSWQ